MIVIKADDCFRFTVFVAVWQSKIVFCANRQSYKVRENSRENRNQLGRGLPFVDIIVPLDTKVCSRCQESGAAPGFFSLPVLGLRLTNMENSGFSFFIKKQLSFFPVKAGKACSTFNLNVVCN